MAPSLNTNGYGGVLPVADWPTADKAVAAAWKNVAAIDAAAKKAESGFYDPGDVGKNLRNAADTYKRAVSHWSTRLEELKHGPVTNVDAVRVWRSFANGLDQDAKFLAGTASLASLTNAISDVAAETANDVKEGVTKGLTIGIPVIVLALVAIIVLKVRK